MLNLHGGQLTTETQHSPKNTCLWLQHITSSSLLVRESQHRHLNDDEHVAPRDHLIRYSRVIINCSNCKGRDRQACPSLYGPAPGARPPSDTTPQVTTPPRLARHQDERRSSCAAYASISSAYHFTLVSDRAALPMVNQSGHMKGLKLHSGVLTRRVIPELCGKRSNTPPVAGAPTTGTNTSSATASRRVVASFLDV